MATAPPPEIRQLRLPAWAWAAFAVVVGFVYLRGIASEPLHGEELPAALVAHEMMTRGDFVVPRLVGEPFVGQPPLPSWLVVLASGGRASRVGALSLRLPGLIALTATGFLVARLGLSAGSGPHALPALVLSSLALPGRHTRAGDAALVGMLFVLGALAAFELGRRRASGALQWVAPQALVAAAALSQGLAPVLFHPPAFVTTWRRRVALRPLAFVAGFALMLALVLAWVDRPLRAAWPLAAALAVGWAAVVWRASARLDATLVVLGLLVVGVAWPVARTFGAATATLVACGLFYGVASAGSSDPQLALRQQELSQTARVLAPYLRPELPVVVRKSVDRRLTWLLAQRLDRALLERGPIPPYDLVVPSTADVPNARFMIEAGGYSVWRVRVPRY